MTLTITDKEKATNRGTIPIFSTLLSLFKLILFEEVMISFWINRISSSTMPIRAIDPASATVVIVETVEVVTVDLGLEGPLDALGHAFRRLVHDYS